MLMDFINGYTLPGSYRQGTDILFFVVFSCASGTAREKTMDTVKRFLLVSQGRAWPRRELLEMDFNRLQDAFMKESCYPPKAERRIDSGFLYERLLVKTVNPWLCHFLEKTVKTKKINKRLTAGLWIFPFKNTFGKSINRT